MRCCGLGRRSFVAVVVLCGPSRYASEVRPFSVMPELHSARQKFPEVWQRGLCWCIPAAIEVVLHYFGTDAVTQEAMVYRYHQKFGDKGFCTPQGQRIRFKSADKSVVIAAARELFLTEAGFGVFADIAKELSAAAQLSFQFCEPPDPNRFTDHLKSSVDAGHGFLMSCVQPDGNWHILAVVGYQGDNIFAYDPQTRQTSSKTATGYCVNNDSLIVRKT